MSLRLVNKGNGSMAYREAVNLIKDITEGADAELVAYYVSRGLSIWQITPPKLRGWAQFLMTRTAPHLDNITFDELYTAGIEARPDCASIFDTEAGRKWLESSFLPELAKGE